MLVTCDSGPYSPPQSSNAASSVQQQPIFKPNEQYGPPSETYGPPSDTYGPPPNSSGSSFSTAGGTYPQTSYDGYAASNGQYAPAEETEPYANTQVIKNKIKYLVKM